MTLIGVIGDSLENSGDSRVKAVRLPRCENEDALAYTNWVSFKLSTRAKGRERVRREREDAKRRSDGRRAALLRSRAAAARIRALSRKDIYDKGWLRRVGLDRAA